jgi:hypothetical protein
VGDARPAGAARLGAYGLRITGADAPHLLVEAEPAWPAVRLSTAIAAVLDEPEEVTDEGARLRLKTGGRIVLDRVAGTARFDVPRRLTSEELVHPYLAPVAAVMSHWLDRESFHAGAIALDGDVWAIAGDRLSGKSSLLASLADIGHSVVTDDLLVVDPATRRVFAGPRSIDLRSEAAERLGIGAAIGRAGARERWRVVVDPVPNALVLRGWVFLSWGERLSIGDVAAARRIELLARHRGVTLAPRDPAALLSYAALPCLELRRPRSWEELPTVTAALVAALRT